MKELHVLLWIYLLGGFDISNINFADNLASQIIFARFSTEYLEQIWTDAAIIMVE